MRDMTGAAEEEYAQLRINRTARVERMDVRRDMNPTRLRDGPGTCNHRRAGAGHRVDKAAVGATP